MDLAARQFARKVLLVHIALMALVAMMILGAWREIYSEARQKVLDQASKRQDMLADQTARGIESHFNSIISNLELVDVNRPLPAAPPQPPGSSQAAAAVRPLWEQLKGRVSMVFIVHIDAMKAETIGEFGVPGDVSAQSLVDQLTDWMRRVQGTTISGPVQTSSGKAALIVVPTATNTGKMLVVAVVPLNRIQNRFLSPIDNTKTSHAVLSDDRGVVLLAADTRIEGLSILKDINNGTVQEMAERHLNRGEPGTEVIATPVTIAGVRLESAMTTFQPVSVGDRRWWLLISSDLREVDSVADDIFRRARFWAGIAIISMTAILVSTAVWMIRSRVKLERSQHQMLSRDIEQARQIQVAWLPHNDDDPRGLDVSAINRAASHISGDFYNWFDLPDGRACIVIGDVTGHGMSAAFLMATTQLMVRTTMMSNPDPGSCLAEVNRQLCSMIFLGQFVTIQILVIDVDKMKLHAATGGHPRPLIGNGNSFQELPMKPQLVLGVNEDAEFPTEHFNLPAGSSLVLYTDGVVDAVASSGDRFDTDQLISSLHGHFGNAQSMIDTVMQVIDTFRAGRELSDDLTLVAVQLQPVAKPSRVLVAAS